ncbi:phage major capsid protein [Paraburkholderia azotifigens]|uniref:phage major capsid protein n=1 Tax=Paraburkholderia azotifigens TaxID=2057004 RepID=UPI0031794DC2
MNTSVLIAAITAALTPKSGFVPRGIVSVCADLSTPDVKALVDNLQQAFAAFKEEHTRQLEAVKAGVPASDITAKVEKIDEHVAELQKAVDDANVKMAAMQMGAGANAVRDAQYTEAFNVHVKRGEVSASLNKGAAPEGGYLTPIEWDRTITDKLVLISPMRQICRVQQVSNAGFSKLFNMRGTASGWVGETESRKDTNTAQFQSLAFNSGEIYANPAATQQILDDSLIDLQTWLADEVYTELAKQEGRAFIAGDGANKPTGILQYVEGRPDQAKHPFGPIRAVASGAAGAITSDSIIDLIYDLPSAFTGNARFTMNRNTQRAVRKLKDGHGNYLWQPSYVAGQPATIAGYPLTEMPDMPDIKDGETPILFGDFVQSYLIIDRVGIRLLRDPYTNKPYVMFYTTKRVGGGLLNPEPMRAMKVGKEKA